MNIGLCLSGGGVRGFAHLGVLKALGELGVTISRISATSAGAIVAALYAYGYKPDEILAIFKDIKLYKSLRPAWTLSGLLTMEGLMNTLHQYLPQDSFAALKIPVTVSATEIAKGMVHYFDEGELVRVLVASASIPVIFKPVEINGGTYVDGGILDNLPVKPLKDHCDLLVGVHCNHIGHEFRDRNLKKMIERTFLLAINSNTQLSRRMCDVFIEPPNMNQYSSFEIDKAQQIFDAGYNFTKQNFLPHHFQKRSTAT